MSKGHGMKTLNKSRKENGPGGVKEMTAKRLKQLKIDGRILWYTRLNAGNPTKRMKLCDAGTFDFEFITFRWLEAVTVFLEIKREGHGVTFNDLDYEQRIFAAQFSTYKNVACAVINHEDQLILLLDHIKGEEKQFKNFKGDYRIVSGKGGSK